MVDDGDCQQDSSAGPEDRVGETKHLATDEDATDNEEDHDSPDGAHEVGEDGERADAQPAEGRGGGDVPGVRGEGGGYEGEEEEKG